MQILLNKYNKRYNKLYSHLLRLLKNANLLL